MALLCSNSTLYIKDPRQFKTSQEAVCDLGANSACCQFPTEVWQDCDGSMFKIVQTINFDKYEFQDFEVLKVSKNSAPYCDKNCFNFRAKGANEFEIKEERGEKVLLTTVTEGQVYIEYFADLEQEFGFMIPDNEKVKDWIFEELRREVYAYLYDNGEEVQNRFAQATRDLSWKHALAKNVYERDEVSTYYNTINKLARRYARMEKWVQGNKFSNQLYGH